MDIFSIIKENMLFFFKYYIFFFIILLMIFFLIFNDLNYFILIIYLISQTVINLIIKIGLKKTMGNKKYPLIGFGNRPKGAMYCDNYVGESKKSSFGMPSGHFQTTIFLFTLLLLAFNKNKSKNKKYLLYKISFIIALSLLIGYSRIYLNCHTLQQIIIGGLLGILLAYLFDKIYNPIILKKDKCLTEK